MRYLKTFESHSINEEEGSIRKFFTGHADKTEEVGSMKTFLTELEKFEKEAQTDDRMVFDKEKLKAKAKANGYKGHLKEIESQADGKYYVMYITGTSEFQKMAKGAAHRYESNIEDESNSVNEEEGSVRKFFTGHSDPTEEFGTMKTFLTELEAFEKEAETDDRMVFNKEALKAKAKENGFKGHLKEIQSQSDGKWYVTYITGTSDFQKIAGAAAHRRDNPLG
jgi:CRISPR/Cas system-associated protein endoribonuclease Cas2